MTLFSHNDYTGAGLFKNVSFLILIGTWIATASAGTKIEVTNSSSFLRESEMIEIPAVDIPELSEGCKFRIVNADGIEQPYQLTHDGLLLLEVTADAGEKVEYEIWEGQPGDFAPVCYGRQFRERKDDLAWENDRSAYRAYGPALQRSGEKAFGYDIWSKSVPYPVLEQRFHDDIVRKISFHDDHGNGMDGYAVGPTLGGGTAALLDKKGNIIYPYCYESYEILDNGPLRFSFRLVYPVVEIDGENVKEIRTISLDKGSWLNKTTVDYEGLQREANVFQGIVVHSSNPNGFKVSPENQFVAYEDFTDAPDKGNGQVYVGIVSPDSDFFSFVPRGKEKQQVPGIKDSIDSTSGDGIEGHVGAVAKTKPGSSALVYYWGSGWSKGGVSDYSDWQRYLSDFSKRLKEPLKISLITK